MTPPPEKCSSHGWTLDTLERHLSSQIDALREVVSQHDARNVERFASRTEATKIAADAAKEASVSFVTDMKERLKQLDLMLPRTVYDMQHAALVGKLDDTMVRIAAIEVTGKARKEGLGVVGAVIMNGITIAISAISTALLMVHLWKG